MAAVDPFDLWLLLTSLIYGAKRKRTKDKQRSSKPYIET
jgi:hypothetical protein